MAGIIGLLALLGGMVSAAAVPAAAFVVGLLIAVVSAGVAAGFAGLPPGRTWFWAAVAYVAAQVGYGLGLAALAFVRPGRRQGSRALGRLRQPGPGRHSGPDQPA